MQIKEFQYSSPRITLLAGHSHRANSQKFPIAMRMANGAPFGVQGTMEGGQKRALLYDDRTMLKGERGKR